MKAGLRGRITIPIVVAFVAFVAGWDLGAGQYWAAGILALIATANTVTLIVIIWRGLDDAYDAGRADGFEDARSIWRPEWL